MATNWGGYNLPALWEMVRTENACTGADRVLAWEGLADSVRTQHERLLKAADALAEVWSPEQNASALAFQRNITELSESMKDTLKCAEDTRIGLRGVLSALSEAQGTMQTLAAGRAEVSDDWVPRFLDHAEDEYDEKAQQVMRNTESAIADHSTNIKAPALYAMQTGIDERGTPFVNEYEGSSGSDAAQGVRAIPVPVAVPHDPVLPEASNGNVGGQPAIDPSLGVGPGLAGVTATPPPPVAPVPGPTVPGLPGQPVGPGGGGGLPLGPIAGGPLLGPGGQGGGFGIFPGQTGRAGASTGRRAVSMRRALPSGAVIGEGELRAGARGGVGQTVLGQAGSRRDGRTAEAESLIGGNPDEQWKTAEGVSPVIVPDSTPLRRDPGPGVIGIDR